MEIMFLEKFKQMYVFRYTLWEMSLKQLKARYANSFLGIFATVINPLLIAFIITFVFKNIINTQVHNYQLFILSGILPWLFFSSAVTESAASIINQQNILKQFTFPRQILPLSSVLVNFFNFLIGLIVVLPFFIFSNPKVLVLLPILLFILILYFIFASGIGLFASMINVFYRDFNYLLGSILMFWLWMTPVFYTTDMIPRQFHWIFNINPMTHFVNSYQNILFKSTIPHFKIFVIISIWATITLISGLAFFVHNESKILKKL